MCVLWVKAGAQRSRRSCRESLYIRCSSTVQMWWQIIVLFFSFLAWITITVEQCEVTVARGTTLDLNNAPANDDTQSVCKHKRKHTSKQCKHTHTLASTRLSVSSIHPPNPPVPWRVTGGLVSIPTSLTGHTLDRCRLWQSCFISNVFHFLGAFDGLPFNLLNI